MKNRKPIKLSALLTAVLLLAAVIVPGAAFAEELPAKNENKSTVNTVSIESNNEIYSPENPVTEVEVGSEFTLTMPKSIPSYHEEGLLSGDDVYFYSWRLSGEYDVVQGSVDEFGDSFDRTLVIKPLSDVSVTAWFEYNTGFHFARIETNSNIYVPDSPGGEVVLGGTFTFSVPKDIPGFIGWEFSGDYDVIEGNVDQDSSSDRTVVLKPRSAVTGFARFAEYSSDENIKVYVDSNNKDYTPETLVTEIKAGSTYTFIAPDDVGNAYFYKWQFSGDYEVVEGFVDNDGVSHNSKVVLRAFSDIHAEIGFVWYDNNDEDFHLVHIQTNNSGYEPECWCAEVGVGEDFVFEVPDDLPGFIRWEFTGSDYEVVEGNVDENGYSSDRKVVLRMWMGVTGFARFSEDGSSDVSVNEEPTNEEPTDGRKTKASLIVKNLAEITEATSEATPDEPGNSPATSDQISKSGVITDKSGTSPKTGDPMQNLPSVIFVIAAFSAIVVLAAKKSKIF